MDKSILFTSDKIGPLALRNRMIRTAAFEGICPGGTPLEQLFNYHTSVTAGRIGMTNMVYAAVTQSGLSFERQLQMRSDIIPGLRKLTDAIHEGGVAAFIQLGYCGDMSHKWICGCTPIPASSGLNLYSPVIAQGMRQSEIVSAARAYGEVVRLAREAGMDAVKIHTGHGYLASQFLSPYTNHRKDEYGGSPENYTRFTRMCMEEVMKAAGSNMVVTIKTNMRDGFKGELEADECLEIVHTLQDQCETHALVLSDGFVSRTPMYVMRGEISIRVMAYHISRGYLLIEIRTVGRYMIPSEPFKEAYFLEDALEFCKALHLPLIHVGGLASRGKIRGVLNDGFESVTTTRALVNESDFVNRMKEDEHARCDCGHSSYCIARMYGEDMVYHKNAKGLPRYIVREIKRPEYK